MNMSYCRFHNTELALRDCFNAIKDGDAEIDDLSEDEAQAYMRLVKLCLKVADYCAHNETTIRGEK